LVAYSIFDFAGFCKSSFADNEKPLMEGMMTSVMIHPADYETVRPAVDRAFDLFPLNVKDRKVLIKPNVLRASKPEEGVVTHPAVLQAVVAKIEEMKPARIVVGDNPGMLNYGANEECFRTTGLMAAAGGYYKNIGNDSVKVDFNRAFMPALSLSRDVADADIIISLPKFKTHGLTIMTGAIKNSYGMLPGAQKAKLHQAAGSPERFHDLIVDVFRLRIPDFFILDAVVGMEGNGPASPDLRNIGLILASNNAVALDTVVAIMMGLDPGRLRFLQKAEKAGLGSHDIDKIKIDGKLERLPGFKLPPLSGEAVMDSPVIQGLISERSKLLLHVDPALCTACETCIEQCPVSALAMVGELPEADPQICITCFCCQEICPEKAIALR
jgi:uncharacterized protein (DUF362 family)/Pyruvate/2-oxoacid:ferredoxin oxidoreductase delta subunit